MNISLRDGSGGLRLSGFFYAWDADRTAADAADLYQLLSNEGSLPTDLRHPVILAALPRTPIAALHFADGTSHDLVSVLEASLELSDATLLGTEGNDQMYGTDGDDVVHLLGGDDFIEEISGNNVIDAGAGLQEHVRALIRSSREAARQLAERLSPAAIAGAEPELWPGSGRARWQRYCEHYRELCGDDGARIGGVYRALLADAYRRALDSGARWSRVAAR